MPAVSNGREKIQLLKSTEHGRRCTHLGAQSTSQEVAGAMETEGTLLLFKLSVSHKLQYKYLMLDADSNSFSLQLKENVYGFGPDDAVVKIYCVGHVEKRMGTAL